MFSARTLWQSDSAKFISEVSFPVSVTGETGPGHQEAEEAKDLLLPVLEKQLQGRSGGWGGVVWSVNSSGWSQMAGGCVSNGAAASGLQLGRSLNLSTPISPQVL